MSSESVFNIEHYLLSDGEHIAETLNEFWQRKERRIRAKYGKGKVDFIMSIESIYENEYPDDACNRIAKALMSNIQNLSRLWSRKAMYSGIRLYPDDFEDVFWEALRVTVLDDYTSGSDFWLYEHIIKKIHSRALDLIQWAKRKKRVHEYTAISLESLMETGRDIADPSSSQLEEEVANRELIMEMFAEPSLTDNERYLLTYLYKVNPEPFLQEIADELGLKYRTQAERLLCSLRKKLSKYKKYMWSSS